MPIETSVNYGVIMELVLKADLQKQIIKSDGVNLRQGKNPCLKFNNQKMLNKT